MHCSVAAARLPVVRTIQSVLWVILLSACSKNPGSLGDPDAGSSDADPYDPRANPVIASSPVAPRPGCTTSSTVLTDLDAPTIVGTTGAELLALLAGTREAMLAYMPDGIARATPGAGATTIAVTATVTSPPRLVMAMAAAPNQDPRLCPDHVAVDGTVTLRTADGALDETWSGPLGVLALPEAVRGRLKPTAVLSLTFNLAASRPRGSLRVDWPDQRPGDIVLLQISATFVGHGTTGWVISTRARPGETFGKVMSVATWNGDGL